MARSSSRFRLLQDSTHGFSQGEPGSMRIVCVPPSRRHTRRALAVSSGPFSERINSGRRPRAPVILSRQAAVASASIEYSTRPAGDSLVSSPTACKILIVRHAPVTSNC